MTMALFVILGIGFLAFLAFTSTETHKAFLGLAWLVMGLGAAGTFIWGLWRMLFT